MDESTKGHGGLAFTLLLLLTSIATLILLQGHFILALTHFKFVFYGAIFLLVFFGLVRLSQTRLGAKFYSSIVFLPIEDVFGTSTKFKILSVVYALELLIIFYGCSHLLTEKFATTPVILKATIVNVACANDDHPLSTSIQFQYGQSDHYEFAAASDVCYRIDKYALINQAVDLHARVGIFGFYVDSIQFIDEENHNKTWQISRDKTAAVAARKVLK